MFPFRIVVVVALCLVSGVASAALFDGVVSAWTFNDGTANDKWGRNDGILQGGATVVDNGKFGRAVDLNGAEAYVEVPHGASMDALANGYTAAAWAYVREGRDHSAIVFKGSMIGWGANFLFRVATTSNTGLTWGGCVEGTEGWFATDNAYQANEWIHVAITADGNEITAYVNGEMPTATGGGTNPNPVVGPYLTFPDQPLRIGLGVGRGGDPNVRDYVDGIIDEVILYRRALSQAEIRQLADFDIETSVEPRGKATTTWGDIKTR